MPREAGDVHLVDHGRRKGPPQRRVALPIVSRSGSTTTLFMAIASFSPVLARALAGIRVGHDDGAPIGIEQNLARIEAQTLPGIERTEGAICVDLSGTDSGHENVPVMVGAVRARIELDHPRRLRRSGIIEQQQLHPSRLPREHAGSAGPGRGRSYAWTQVHGVPPCSRCTGRSM